MRKISFCDAINEALVQEMTNDPSVFVYGIGVPDHKKIFGTTRNLVEKFGERRCFDTPLAEDGLTGFGLGAALNGLRPVQVHIRVDFMLLAMNQIVNMVSTATYGSGGKLKVPMVIRGIVGRGWGQGYQHSKSLHSYFTHIPGLKVVCPTTPADAKGLLTTAIRDDNPVIFLEHRWLYWAEDEVPEGDYSIPFGKANILREGSDISIIATSWMNIEALRAAELANKYHGLSVEVVDPRTLYPLDTEMLVNSVRKTGHCIVADNDWASSGFGAEVACEIYDAAQHDINLCESIDRVGFAHTPCPTARHLENKFYPNAERLLRVIEKQFRLSPAVLDRSEQFYSHELKFKGPF